MALAFGVALVVWRGRWQKLMGLGLVWFLAMLGIQFLLLPALWTSPVGTYQTIIGTIFHETEEVLPRTFFMGSYAQSHGPAFYMVALLYRLNPVVFVGLLLARGLAGGGNGRWVGGNGRIAGWQSGWPIFFIVVLCLATKKYDRYLLPALPMLFLLGMLGWGVLLRGNGRPGRDLPRWLGQL
ncbi:MAG: hypothetical protein H6656_13760 [Ardenticatenaceae bacterium]|nr:hypothetical protein [Ardenticatenaceae bacterium]